MSNRRVETALLVEAGRLLLEYNESTGSIHRVLARTARALTRDSCTVSVEYGGVSVSIGDDAPLFQPVRELRYNMRLQSRVRGILADLQARRLDAVAARTQLSQALAESPRHPRGLAVSALALAAAALALILGADAGAAVAAGVSTGLGLLVRQELGRRHANLLALPLTAALMGSLIGSAAIQLGWTASGELALIVPALMLVPGPHLINGLLDLVENYLPMSVARLTLATGILLSSALGIVLGIELTDLEPLAVRGSGGFVRLNVLTDMALAGIVTCGFAVFYNSAWRHVGLAALGGMAGHGTRFLALEVGCRLVVATFLGGLVVGMVSGWLARSARLPVAIVAFAGAVTMMPGLLMYRAFGGALQLAHQHESASAALPAATLANAFEASLVVVGLALGLVAGASFFRSDGRSAA